MNIKRGGVIRCHDCRTRNRPLTWRSMWDEWLCNPCVDRRIAGEVEAVAK